MTVSHPRSISSNSKLESLAAASMAISTQEGGTRKRRNLSLRCNSEANSSGTESQGSPFTAHFGYAGLASPVTEAQLAALKRPRLRGRGWARNHICAQSHGLFRRDQGIARRGLGAGAGRQHRIGRASGRHGGFRRSAIGEDFRTHESLRSVRSFATFSSRANSPAVYAARA